MSVVHIWGWSLGPLRIEVEVPWAPRKGEWALRVGRLELAIGRPFKFHRWPALCSWPSEEVLLVLYWRAHYVSLCWLRK